MRIRPVFIGKAEPLAALYEGVGAMSFVVRDANGSAEALAVPSIGDRVSLRMQPGSDTRTFRCTGRHWHFCAEEGPELRIELDMA